MNEVKIVEVGARDGLQNESKIFSVEERVELIQKLVDAGLKFLEGGSFVSPKAIPQMVDSEKVWDGCKNLKADLSFLVANEKGLDRALEANVKSIAIFTATSDSFTKNIQQTVDESLKNFSAIAKRAKEKKLRIRGYVSTAFGCPYEGKQEPARVYDVVDQLFKLGCEEVSVGDTIGVAHPAQIKEIFGNLIKTYTDKKIAAHLHDTRGAALSNILEALNQGVRIFDSSIGGLGGCPYATGSSGNVATEEVAWLLEGFGFKTGLEISKLLKVAEWAEARVGHGLKAKLFLSKPRELFYF